MHRDRSPCALSCLSLLLGVALPGTGHPWVHIDSGQAHKADLSPPMELMALRRKDNSQRVLQTTQIASWRMVSGQHQSYWKATVRRVRVKGQGCRAVRGSGLRPVQVFMGPGEEGRGQVRMLY